MINHYIIEIKNFILSVEICCIQLFKISLPARTSMFTFAPSSGSWIFWFLETHRLYVDWAPPDPCVNGDVLWDLRSAFLRGEFCVLFLLAKASGLFRLVGSFSDCCLPLIYSVFVKHVPIAFSKLNILGR